MFSLATLLFSNLTWFHNLISTQNLQPYMSGMAQSHQSFCTSSNLPFFISCSFSRSIILQINLQQFWIKCKNIFCKNNFCNVSPTNRLYIAYQIFSKYNRISLHLIGAFSNILCRSNLNGLKRRQTF